MTTPQPDAGRRPRFLLIGPYDPHCGEYTFLAPPLGVWRLQGVIASEGFPVEIFDPNCCDDDPAEALAARLARHQFDIVGVSTTGMTLKYDLELAHVCRRASQTAVIVAGGMEATFRPELLFQLGPFDLVVLGEGERPLLEIAARINAGGSLSGIAGTAVRTPFGVQRFHQPALSPSELREAIFRTPYHRMPYRRYWDRLEQACRVGQLASKAEREARLCEIRSVRLITLNYCPMACTFCSSTNFLHAAQGGTAPIARLDADDCLAMLQRIVAAQPDVRTVVFQDDIFTFTSDKRILPLCEQIGEAKRTGRLPRDLQFVSTNRIDAMTPERLAAMRAAGFRVLGFGIENFSPRVLEEFNKARIVPYIAPVLRKALELGITPFLDMIMTSPRCTLDDLGETVRQGYRWLLEGCEIGMYPYVIPFSGAAMTADPTLKPHTIHVRRSVRGTTISWDQPTKILPIDDTVRGAILAAEESFDASLSYLESRVAHLPSRLRSLLWIACTVPVLTSLGEPMPSRSEVLDQLLRRLPPLEPKRRRDLEQVTAVPACA